MMLKAAFFFGTVIEMKQEAMSARVAMANEMMMTNMGNHFKNFSILLQKHAKPCADLAENITDRAKAVTLEK